MMISDVQLIFRFVPDEVNILHMHNVYTLLKKCQTGQYEEGNWGFGKKTEMFQSVRIPRVRRQSFGLNRGLKREWR